MQGQYLTNAPILFSDPVELANMLAQAEKAHAASGHPAENWQEWYANWIFEQFV